MDIDAPSLNGMTLGEALGDAAEQAFEDEEYKIWKQVTKKDRALIAKERFQLFSSNKLNVDEPALLRTKAGMKRFLNAQKIAEANGILLHGDASAPGSEDAAKQAETLAEGMEDEVNRVVPDYYEPLAVVPDIEPIPRWARWAVLAPCASRCSRAPDATAPRSSAAPTRRDLTQEPAMIHMIDKVLIQNGLITAFALVGLIMWVSSMISRKLTFGRVHGSGDRHRDRPRARRTSAARSPRVRRSRRFAAVRGRRLDGRRNAA